MVERSLRNSESRPRLGRGLAALLGESRSVPAVDNTIPNIIQVPIEFVRSNARNPRTYFDESELEELAASIKQRGIIQPIIVRSVTGVADTYEIIAGERRWRAAQRAGQHAVPVICLEIEDREALELSIVENVQRSNLNALEEAQGYNLLALNYGYSQLEISRVVGKSRSHVANTIRLLALPERTQELLKEGAISAGHARALLGVDDPDTLSSEIVASGLTVRDVEKISSGSRPERNATEIPNEDPNLADLANRISLHLGVKVSLVQNKKTFAIAMKCKDFRQMEYICDRLLKD